LRLILASGSPRRRELLSQVGLPFEVMASDLEERQDEGEDVESYVRRLASDKAAAIAAREPDAWILAADTVVYLDEEVLEKPQSRSDAIRMLTTIAGREHTVFTGVALRHLTRDYTDATVTATIVRMMPLTAREIEWYVDTGEPMDKAGAYAIQGLGAMFVESVSGNYNNVMGLPLARVYAMLKKAGLDHLAGSAPR